MTRIRDIARIIGRSEAPNTNNRQYITEAPFDSAKVTNIIRTESSPIANYDSIDALPTSGLTLGDRAFIKTDSNNARFYISNGSGWYNAALFNTSPSITLDSDSYSIDSDDGTTVITISDSDFDQANLLAPTIAFIPSNITDSAVNTSISGDTITLSLRDSASGVYDAKIIVSRSDGNAVSTDSASLNITLASIVSLTASSSSVNEGNSVTFTLVTTVYDSGSTFNYTITGIQAEDIEDSLTGTMTIANDSARATITTVKDQTTEGDQTMTFTIDNTSFSENVTISDTSDAPTSNEQYEFRGGTTTVTNGQTLVTQYIGSKGNSTADNNAAYAVYNAFKSKTWKYLRLYDVNGSLRGTVTMRYDGVQVQGHSVSSGRQGQAELAVIWKQVGSQGGGSYGPVQASSGGGYDAITKMVAEREDGTIVHTLITG